MDKEFPCRTKEISGIRYRVRMFLNGELRMSTSFESKEDSDRHNTFMAERLPNLTFEVKEEPWKSKVCIECGEESIW